MEDSVTERCHRSLRVAAVQVPIIPTINKLVNDNPGTISLGQGVAYYSPPQEAFDELTHHLSSPLLNSYGPVEGIPELIDALQQKLKQENFITLGNSNAIFVTAGSNMAFSSLMLALTDPGDEIILLTPYYFNHEMAVRLASAIPILVPTQKNFHPDIDAIKSAITAKTRAVVTISPNNPTGAVYSKQELIEINELCSQYGIYHISDEAYENFVYDGHRHFSPASLDNTDAHTISLFSFSKAYGFAGWRVGYMLIPDKIFSELKKIQDTVLISPPIVCQVAALGALRAPGEYFEENIKEIIASRQYCLNQLNSADVLSNKASSEGAFYIFARLNTETNDTGIAIELIKRHQIATIPGTAFAANDGSYLRISFGALTGHTVKTGIEKLVAGLKEIV